MSSETTKIKPLKYFLDDMYCDENGVTSTIDIIVAVKEWLQQYLHDFPDQFPRNRPKYSIENEFIQKRLEELK